MQLVGKEPDPETIEQLELMLQMAKDGDLTGIMYVMRVNGDVVHGWDGQPCPAMLGELQCLSHCLMNELYPPPEVDF